jgi:hypothetical protein
VTTPCQQCHTAPAQDAGAVLLSPLADFLHNALHCRAAKRGRDCERCAVLAMRVQLFQEGKL